MRRRVVPVTRSLLCAGIFLILALPVSAQIINTYAGNGTAGYSGDGGPATAAELNRPVDVEVDAAGDLYIADYYNSVIRKVDAATGIITTVAGVGPNGSAGCAGETDSLGDGCPATSASLLDADWLVLSPSGDMYISDERHYLIRKVSAATGLITTYAGNGLSSGGTCAWETDGVGDGCPATSASLQNDGLALDAAGNLYIGDTFDMLVRVVDAATGIISAYAGTGARGYTGNGGPATNAELDKPVTVWFNAAGNLALGDFWNNVVREISSTTGIISTVAGNGFGSDANDYCTGGYTGDGGPATAAEFNNPAGIRFDTAGNMYIADSCNSVVRKVDAVTGIITTVAGDGTSGYGGDGGPATSAELSSPWEITCDSLGNLYIGDYYNNRVRVVSHLTAPCSIMFPTQVALASNLNPSVYGVTVTFTATVTPYPGPTGAVAFAADGTTLAGCAAVTLSGGRAQCATSMLAAGSHTVTAAYSGDSRYAPSSGAMTQAVTQAVLTAAADNLTMTEGSSVPTLTYTMTGFMNGDTEGTATTGQPSLSTTGTPASPPGAYPIVITQGALAAANYSFEFIDGTLTITLPSPVGSFLISATPVTQTVIPGAQAVYQVTVTSLDNFAGPVALTCAGAPGGGSCSFGQSTLTLAANGSATTTMSVTTKDASSQASVLAPVRLFPGAVVPATALSLGLCASAAGRKRIRRRWLTLIVTLLFVTLSLVSCGCPSTQHEIYTVNITGTSMDTMPAIENSTSVNLVVK
jgi:hypothetical protein